MKIKLSLYLTILLVFIEYPIHGSEIRTGTISGIARDSETQAALALVNVLVESTQLGSVSAEDGSFLIERVPVGSYTLRFRYLGYDELVRTDVIVRPARNTEVPAAMRMSALQGQSVTVRGAVFSKSGDRAVSAVSFDFEEVRRAPGSGGDVSRIVMGLPSLAKVNDQSNGLIVRGGSPAENAFYIDQVEVPNINHFPAQGASGGPIGMVNVDFLSDVTFHAGGFGAAYGDRLSSVMDLTFREGSRAGFEAQLDLNFAGFGGVAEGPLPKGKGSWLASIRRSYLDWVIRWFDVGSTVVPRYGDAQWKVVWDVNPAHRVELLGLWGDDHNRPDREAARKNDMSYYGNQDLAERTTGLVWRALWGRSAVSTTAFSLTENGFDEDYFDTGSGLRLLRNRSLERWWKIRNVNRWRLSRVLSLEFGMDWRRSAAEYDNTYGAYTDAFGRPTAELVMSGTETGTRLGLFSSASLRPHPLLCIEAGLRLDRRVLGGRAQVSPRVNADLRLTDRLSLHAAAGSYVQPLPPVLLAQAPENAALDDPRAVHAVAGLEFRVSEDTRLTVEAYRKTYSRFPMDPSDPHSFLMDELSTRYGYFFGHGALEGNGRADSRGLEFLLQKKLTRRVYGMAGVSCSSARYRDGAGLWRDRVYDNRFVFSAEGGFKPNRSWEFSARVTGAGGVPHTPFDAAASEALGRAVLDSSRVNGERFPDYFSLNVRFDRRFHFRTTNLVAYLSAWNVTNRKNPAALYWDAEEGREKTIYQWALLPVFGLEYEF